MSRTKFIILFLMFHGSQVKSLQPDFRIKLDSLLCTFRYSLLLLLLFFRFFIFVVKSWISTSIKIVCTRRARKNSRACVSPAFKLLFSAINYNRSIDYDHIVKCYDYFSTSNNTESLIRFLFFNTAYVGRFIKTGGYKRGEGQGAHVF